ncbi:SDR family oxidoreductase, partial [Oleiphilus sp. HI0066]|uniref:SDR family oxidoreductase n=1 Tax=Oleiphilus sp. HI0066 TaxID=1822242 RepID=UPI000AEBD58A
MIALGIIERIFVPQILINLRISSAYVLRSLPKDKTMSYFITGGTGFIGRFLVEKLLARGETI